jgi:hypothetical protein
VGRLPGREALEAELETAERLARPPEPKPEPKPEPTIVAWDRRVAPEKSPEKRAPTLTERLRALLGGR